MKPDILKQLSLSAAFLEGGFTIAHAAFWLFVSSPASLVLALLVAIGVISFGGYLGFDAVKDFLSPDAEYVNSEDAGGYDD